MFIENKRKQRKSILFVVHNLRNYRNAIIQAAAPPTFCNLQRFSNGNYIILFYFYMLYVARNVALDLASSFFIKWVVLDWKWFNYFVVPLPRTTCGREIDWWAHSLTTGLIYTLLFRFTSMICPFFLQLWLVV